MVVSAGVVIVLAWVAVGAAAIESFRLRTMLTYAHAADTVPPAKVEQAGNDKPAPEADRSARPTAKKRGVASRMRRGAPVTPATHEDPALASIRSGQYTPLPPDEILPGAGNTAVANVVLTNSTSYPLRVFVSGPAERTVTLAPNASRIVEVPSGTYEVAGQLEGGDRAAFYGDHSYAAGGRYRQDFQESFLVMKK